MAKIKLIGVVVLIVLFAGISGAPPARADDLLVNGNFEENPTSATITGWNILTESGPARYDNMQVYAAREGVMSYVFAGENAVIITAQDHGTEPFVANLYQQVHGVTPGVDYSFSGWSLAFWGGSGRFPDEELHTDKIGRVVGIDPYGGTAPASPNVVWGKERWRDGRRQNIYVAATALSSTITVFFHVINTGDIDHSTCIIDEFYLAPAPRIEVDPLPAYQTDPTINLSWRLLSIPPGTNFADYNVEYRVDDGEWGEADLAHPQATSFTFQGEDGRTYTFRVRARSRLAEWPNSRIAGNFERGTVQTTISAQGPPPPTATPEPTTTLPPTPEETSIPATSTPSAITPRPVYLPVVLGPAPAAATSMAPYPIPPTATPLPLPTPVPIQTNTPVAIATSESEPSITPTIDIGAAEEPTLTPTIDIGAAGEPPLTPTIDIGGAGEEPTATPTVDTVSRGEARLAPTPAIGVATNTPVIPVITIPTATPMGGGVLSPTGFGLETLLTGLLLGGIVVISRLLRSML